MNRSEPPARSRRRTPGPCPPRARTAEDDRPAAALWKDPAEPGGPSPASAAVTPRRRGGHPAVWKWAGVAAAAAAIVTGFALLMQERPALAKGETVVREARRAHLLPIDRCYLVEVRRESSLVAELSPANPQVRQTRLVDPRRPVLGRIGAARTALGVGPRRSQPLLDRFRAPHGRAAGRRRGPLLAECLLRSPLAELREVARRGANRFELTRETKPGDADSSTIVVRAEAKARANSAVPVCRQRRARDRRRDARSSAAWLCAESRTGARSPPSPTL